jgi:hypothetical protein
LCRFQFTRMVIARGPSPDHTRTIPSDQR